MKMKKYFYLLAAVVCSMTMFTACSDDDDDNNGGGEETKVIEELVGTWNVLPIDTVKTSTGELYNGSAVINWVCNEGTSLSIIEGWAMDMNTTVIPLMSNMATTSLNGVLNSVTFTRDGNITAQYREAADSDEQPGAWQTAEGYATYEVINDNLIQVYLTDKVLTAGDDAEDKTMLTAILSLFKDGVPIHIRWEDAAKTQPFFYIDQTYMEQVLTGLTSYVSSIDTSKMDEEDLATFNMLKSIMTQLPEVMNNTTTFEAGLKLQK